MRMVVLTVAVGFVGMVGGASAAAARHNGAATSVKITRWEVSSANFFSGTPDPTIAPGKTFRHCTGSGPAALIARFVIQGPKHVTAQAIWRRNGRVHDTYRVKDLGNPSGQPPPPDGPPLSLAEGPYPQDGKWSLTIKELGKVIGSSTLTLASKRC